MADTIDFEPLEEAAVAFEPSETVDFELMEEAPPAEAPTRPMLEVLKNFANTPTLTVSPRTVAALSPVLGVLPEKVATGIAKGVANVASSLTSPANIAIGIGSLVQPQIGLGVMAGLAAKQAGTAFGEASVAAETGETEEAARLGTEGAAALLGAAVAPLHAMPRGGATPPRIAEAAPVAKAPATDAAPLAAVPEGTSFAQQAIELFRPARPEATPPLRIDRDNVIPRLQPYETEKLLAVQPEGMAKVPVLGALVDPRSTAKTGIDVAIITRAHSVNKGRTLASLWAESQHRNRDLFNAGDDGTITLMNGERGYISDVIEAEIRDPGSQRITEAQRAWINDEWLPLREDVNKMLTEEGVKEVQAEEFTYDPATDYFPRPAIGKRNRDAAATGQSGGGRPGSAPFYEKARRFETEFEGARGPRAGEQKEVVIYDPNAVSRATKFILGAYRAVADHRLANDAALGGETVKARFDTLVERNQARLDLLPEEARADAETQLREQAAYPIWGKEERVNIAPAFANKIYPIETARRLRGAYADDVRGWVRAAQNVTSATKAMMATADMSAPLVQGAAMMGRHPLLWAKSTLNSYRSLLDPKVTAKVLERPEYQAAAQEFSQSGGSLLQLQDFLAGNEQGALATRIPGYGRVVEATGRAYGTFLDLAKLELWRAWKEVTPADQWGKLAEGIESSLFTGRMESIGLNAHRTVGERLLLFAPMYYRGAGNLLANAFQRGVSGSMARQMIGGYAAAGTLVTIGSWLAMGLSEEEIERRLDPRRGTFLKVPVTTGDGGRVEVGVGNVLTQLLRLSGQAAAYHSDDKPIDTGVEGNPYLRFLRGRAAFLPSLAIDIATGTDYLGNPITIKEATARHFMPFVLQSMFPREETAVPVRAMDAAFSFFGLNAFPESEYATQLRHLDESARAEHGKPLFELPLAERARAVRAFESRPDYKDREPTMQDMRRFLKLDVERRDGLRKAMSEESRATLDRLGVDAGSYKSTLTIGGVNVPLSKVEQERYEALLAESFNAHLAKLPAEANDATPAAREKWWTRYAAAIRAEARGKLMQELAKPRQQ